MVALITVIVVWVTVIVVLVAAGRRIAARELAALIPNLLGLFKGLFTDPRVPAGSKLLLGLAIAWIISPVDLVPEFLPLLGPLDDAVVAALVLRHLVRVSGPDVVREHWRGDPRTLETILRLARIGRRASAWPGRKTGRGRSNAG
jgi:uncharacterized membrane protein YkvA (DUF1232 family)